jgi:hypothetical protein
MGEGARGTEALQIFNTNLCNAHPCHAGTISFVPEGASAGINLFRSCTTVHVAMQIMSRRGHKNGRGSSSPPPPTTKKLSTPLHTGKWVLLLSFSMLVLHPMSLLDSMLLESMHVGENSYVLAIILTRA